LFFKIPLSVASARPIKSVDGGYAKCKRSFFVGVLDLLGAPV